MWLILVMHLEVLRYRKKIVAGGVTLPVEMNSIHRS